jgi:aldehyde dehydrogenase (NAD+)
MALHRNFINGEWLEGKGVRENINPSDITDIVGEYAQADTAQTEAAIAAAKAAQPSWAASTPQVKADVLEFIGTELLARKDEIGRLLSREEGKPLANGIAETMRAAQIFKFFAQEALRVEGVAISSIRPGVDVTITREALGVVGLICPWNFPHRHSGLENGPSAGLRQCGGVQARRPRSRFRLGAGRDHLALRPAEGCVQPRDGPWRNGGPDIARLARRACHFLHRLG